jgi:8-oxo-dGTP pyrophosphatase MutT (NUDIX family)
MKKKRDVASVLVKFGDECLLCKRSPDQSYPRTWSIPGGGVEKDEEHKQAAAREFFEETAINVSENDLQFKAVIPKFKKSGKSNGLMYIYLWDSPEKVHPNLSQAKDGWEHTECKYFDPSKLDKMGVGTNLFNVIQKVFGLS